MTRITERFREGVAPRSFCALLIACAVVPFARDETRIIVGRAGIYGMAAVSGLYVLLAAAIYLAITIEVANATQRVDAMRVAATERLRVQVDRMPIACITVSTSFAITSWNPAAERIFGYSAGEIIGKRADLLLPCRNLEPELDEGWRRVLTGDAEFHSVNENRTKDGRAILCRWSNTPLVNDRGETAAVLCMAEDITHEEKTRHALLASEARHRELVDSLPHYIFSVDNEDRYIAVNAAICKVFCLREDQIIGRTPDELGVPINIASSWKELKARTRATNATQTADSEIAVNRRQRLTRVTASPLRDRDGTIAGVTCIAIDITQQRQAEAAMRRLLSAVEQVDEVIFITDRDGVITDVNRAFERTYGYTRAEAIGQTPRILKSGELPPEHYRRLWSEIVSGRSIRMEYVNRRKDGTPILVVGSANPLFDDEGRITGFIAVQQDVTEQRRAEEERRKLDEQLQRVTKMEALGNLAGGLAHDFNNILSIILTHATLIERRQTDSRQVSRAVGTVKQAVKRGASLSRQILTLARRGEINVEPLHLTMLILELASMISETFPRTIQVTLDLEPDLPLISADSGKLHQALLNLCVNARDAMPLGGELSIQTRWVPAAAMNTIVSGARDADHVCVSISDTGTGVDDQTRSRMFEPFFTTKEKGNGTGLGLALVDGIVNSHHGVIDVESSVGRGTTFHLYFPILAPKSVTAPIEERQVPGGDKTLVVIEDEPAILDALSDHLRENGYGVHSAKDGVAAIEFWHSFQPPPDAVLMDLGMPKISAEEFLRRLRVIAPSIPVVAMTGYVDPEAHDGVVRAGVTRIMQKPFEIGELLCAVHEACASSATQS